MLPLYNPIYIPFCPFELISKKLIECTFAADKNIIGTIDENKKRRHHTC